MSVWILLLEIILSVIGCLSFTLTKNIALLWGIALGNFTISWIKYNYSTSRIVTFLFLFLITLCGNTNYMLYFAAVDAIIGFIIMMLNGHCIPKKTIALFPWIFMVLFGIIGGLLFAVDKTSFHIGIEVYVLLTAMLLTTELFIPKNKIEFDFIVKILCVINIGIVSLFFLSNSIDGLLSITRGLIRLLGETGIRSNTLAGIVLVFFIGLYSLRGHFKTVVEKTVLYVTLSFDVIILLFLQSRGSYVAIAGTVLFSACEVLILEKNLDKKNILKGIIALLALIVLLFIPSIQNVLNEFVFGRFFSFGSDISNGRIALFQKAVDMWKNHWLIGNGFLQFDGYGMEFGDPHNFILGYLASCGLFGFIALCVFLFRVFRLKDYNTRIDIKPLRYIMLAQIIHGLFEPVLTTSLPLSLFILTCILIIAIKREEVEIEN